MVKTMHRTSTVDDLATARNNLRLCEEFGGEHSATILAQLVDCSVAEALAQQETSAAGLRSFIHQREDAARRRGEQKSVVYCIEATGLAVIKIGWTVNLGYRLRALRCASPVELKLVGSFEGSRSDEQGLHRRFAGDRVRPGGEWFRASSELLTFIEGLS